MKNRFAVVLIATIGAGVAAVALAQKKPEDDIKYRQSAMFIIGQNFGPLAAMAQNKIPYNKEAAIRHATVVEFLSVEPFGHFVPGTETEGNTKAKPELWQNMDDFKAKSEKMQSEVTKLAQVSKTEDFNALKAQVGETGKACKACHDDYREK